MVVNRNKCAVNSLLASIPFYMDYLHLPLNYTFERSEEAYKESSEYIKSTDGTAGDLSTYFWVYHSIHDIWNCNKKLDNRLSTF